MRTLTGIHLPDNLTFVCSEERYSVYRRPDDTEVYLAHGTARELVEFDEIDLQDEWQRFLNTGGLSWESTKFLDHLRGLTHDWEAIDDEVGFCADCHAPDHVDDQCSTGYSSVCERCDDEYYTCDSCENRYRSTTTTLYDSEVCSSCRDDHYSYCDHCEGYYHDESDDDHSHGGDGGCGCESPAQVFTVRNDGDAPLANDTLTTITLPAGVISDEGLYNIANHLRTHSYNLEDTEERQKVYALSYRMGDIGPKWQAKDGNFTKRLSRFAYKEAGIKLPPEVISEVGNIARDHSTAVDFDVAVTRDLNQSAEDFAHEESCWWQSYYHGRCALKSNGGFGLRSFHPDGWVTGRAWVLPLLQTVDGDLTPTFDALTPDAFMLFNGYGSLSGYTAARIWSHMTGMTYRKVEFSCTPMYVNSDSGYLVAPEEIAERFTDGCLDLSVEQHSSLFTREKKVLTNA